MSKLNKLRAIIKEEIKKSLNEQALPHLKTPSDVSYYNRDWGKVFGKWADRHSIDFGPRESDMYDWNDGRYYDKVVKEFHAHMNWVAKDLNTASVKLEGAYKAWNKIMDKYRKMDKS